MGKATSKLLSPPPLSCAASWSVCVRLAEEVGSPLEEVQEIGWGVSCAAAPFGSGEILNFFDMFTKAHDLARTAAKKQREDIGGAAIDQSVAGDDVRWSAAVSDCRCSIDSVGKDFPEAKTGKRIFWGK